MVKRAASFRLEVALQANCGEIVAVLGPNGSGKSTLLSALAGLLPIDEGAIRLGERVWDSPNTGEFVRPVDRNLGVVFQDLLLFPHLSVLENVAFGLRSRGLGRGQAKEMAASWADKLGVADLADTKANKLSGGQAQRVAIARALASEADLMLLDEPLSALDIATQHQVLPVLSNYISSRDIVGILVTHDPNEAFLLASDLYVIESGRVTQHGSPDEVYSNPATAYIEAVSSKVAR